MVICGVSSSCDQRFAGGIAISLAQSAWSLPQKLPPMIQGVSMLANREADIEILFLICSMNVGSVS
jgi:hypothetical protein